ncbi:tripartite tricarboxylate transporter substrate binding protein [Hydrogenophaga sp.]|uniref:Bug family tripartite tricarboxylate transporter substrate binding protein n=1 Tax=Hydrogenophaga sp. TaxID=1904254 RepID=UPI00271CBBF2|nr:tripartite tricarboxylate transporter substrate binding protein [Hydrogenophaga sp.]MDO9434184.1 tripartite tricarboxylate transporter substrate binding protein [Hydrogenophaga sp.]
MNHKKLAVLFSATLLSLSHLAFAQTQYPSKPIRVIVPYPAGGGTDAVARAVFEKVGQAMGQPVVIENKAGAGTIIGLGEVARAAPDGYTIGIGGTSDPLLPLLYESVPFNPNTDLVFVSTLASVPLALAASNNVPAKTMQELVAYGKTQSGPLSIATAGLTSPHHMAAILLGNMAGFPLTAVPYKGTAPAVTDIVGGHIPLGMLGLPSVLPYQRTGKLKILGVGSPKRSALAPEILTFEEQGVKGYEASYWFHATVPKGTPAAIVERLRTEIDKVVRSADVRDSLAKAGFETLTLSPQESAVALKADTARWTKVIQENKLRGTQ